MTFKIIERVKNRAKFLILAMKMFTITKDRGLRLIMENPWNGESYLKDNFITPPSIIDNDRTRRGDVYKKPTAYWFVNCEPTSGFTYEPSKVVKKIREAKGSNKAGVCSEERSTITSTYARNFINDFILGRNVFGNEQPTILDLIDKK